MILVLCATEFELQPLLDLLPPAENGWVPLVSGVGMVETTFSLTRYLEQHGEAVHAVLNCGVGGAYVGRGNDDAGILDICLAEEECFGDFGICYPDRVDPLADAFVHRSRYSLDPGLLSEAAAVLCSSGFSLRQGTFVTVCGVSATASRGSQLGGQYDALCENMEGAAAARVCEEYSLPLLEMRTISNYVEDRDCSRWKMSEACALAGKAAAALIEGMNRR